MSSKLVWERIKESEPETWVLVRVWTETIKGKDVQLKSKDLVHMQQGDDGRWYYTCQPLAMGDADTFDEAQQDAQDFVESQGGGEPPEPPIRKLKDWF